MAVQPVTNKSQELYVPDEGIKVMAICPASKEEVMIDEQKHCDSDYGKMVWWRCSSCSGWHLLRLKDVD